MAFFNRLLGGALATLLAAEWSGERSVDGVFTYGQPRVGDEEFRGFLNQRLGARFSRFVNDDDIVARVPPGYRHMGTLYHFDEDGSLLDSTESLGRKDDTSEQPPALTEAEFDQLRASLLVSRAVAGEGRTLENVTESASSPPALEGFFPSFRDHNLAAYIRKIQAMAG
jgi:hypothetical protein